MQYSWSRVLMFTKISPKWARDLAVGLLGCRLFPMTAWGQRLKTLGSYCILTIYEARLAYTYNAVMPVRSTSDPTRCPPLASRFVLVRCSSLASKFVPLVGRNNHGSLLRAPLAKRKALVHWHVVVPTPVSNSRLLVPVCGLVFPWVFKHATCAPHHSRYVFLA